MWNEPWGLARPGGDLLSRDLGRSTIGSAALNGRVRDGIGCGGPAMATGPPRRILCPVCPGLVVCFESARGAARCCVRCPFRDDAAAVGSELVRAIRTARLSGSPHVHPRPIHVLVWHGPDREAPSGGGFPA